MTEQDPISLDARTQIDPDPSPLVGSEAPPNPDLPEIVAEQPAEIPVEEPPARQFVDDGLVLLQWAERKYGGSQLDGFFQKDQVTRIQFNRLRIRD